MQDKDNEVRDVQIMLLANVTTDAKAASQLLQVSFADSNDTLVAVLHSQRVFNHLSGNFNHLNYLESPHTGRHGSGGFVRHEAHQLVHNLSRRQPEGSVSICCQHSRQHFTGREVGVFFCVRYASQVVCAYCLCGLFIFIFC
jgi:hypothetical protein